MRAKRFFAESGKEKKRMVEITDIANAVFRGQVFREMLAALRHKEHHRYFDQEIPPQDTHIPTGHALPRSSRFLFPTFRPAGVASCDQSFVNSYRGPFAIYITHTSFQLYHCSFPAGYVREIHDMVLVHEHGGVILQSSPLYEFCKVEQRGEWIRILVGLIEFLRSGESKMGYLNRTLARI